MPEEQRSHSGVAELKEEADPDHARGVEVQGQAPCLKHMDIDNGQLTGKRWYVGSMKQMKRRKVRGDVGDK